MPNKQNAKKALRQSHKRAVRNATVKNTYKKAVKEVQKGLASGSKDLKEQIRLAQKALDKAAKRGVVKAGNASRKISRLMKKVNIVKK